MMYIFIIFSFLFDGILTNFFPFFQGTLSLFTPYLSIVCIFLLPPFFRKGKEKRYIWFVAIYGILYDIFYTNIWMSHVILFLEIAYFSKLIWKNVELNYITIPIFTAILIGVYHFSYFSLFVFFHRISFSIESLLYLWGHSLLFNIIDAELFYFLFHKRFPKYQ